MFPIISGRSCSFDETLAVSGDGIFTFAYAFPYLYVCDENAVGVGKILIYDVSSAASPVLLSTTNVPSLSGPRFPVIVGNTLYVPYHASGVLALWNVTDRTAPVLLGSCSVGGNPSCVAVLGTIAAVGFGDNFVHAADAEKIDVSNPASPTVVDSVLINDPTPTLVTAIHATTTHFIMSGQFSSGGVMYVAGVNASTFNVSDVATDGLVAAGIFNDMVISSDYQYAFCSNNGNTVVDSWSIADPTNISMLDQEPYTSGAGGVCLLLVDDTDRLYVGRTVGGSGIRIMNVADPANMSDVGSIATGGETVSDMVNTDGCPGFVWGQGTGAAIHLIGTAPLS